MDQSEWACDRCGQTFQPGVVPKLIPTDHGNQFVHQDECPSEQIGGRTTS